MCSSGTKPAIVIFTFQEKKVNAVMLCLFLSVTVKYWGKSILLLSSGAPQHSYIPSTSWIPWHFY